MNKNNVSYFHPSFLISSVFGLGKFPLMPGTIGSVIGVILFCLIALLFKKNDNINVIICYGLVIFSLFVIGMIASTIYVKKITDRVNENADLFVLIKAQDPKEVIIDEVVGQMLTLFLTSANAASLAHGKHPWEFVIIVIIAPFILFRFFDIIKPWPISWIDKNIKNGFGIMIDDIVAAIMAAIFYNMLLFQLK